MAIVDEVIVEEEPTEENTAPDAVKDEEVKVKVFKKANDATTFFCGEEVQVSASGREFFELSPNAEEAVASNSNLIWPK